MRPPLVFSRYASQQPRLMSAAERQLWYRLRAGGLDGHVFLRQQSIGPYLASFYCAAVGLVIEVVEEVVATGDQVRHRFFEHMGLQVLQLDSQQVLHALDEVLDSIVQALHSS
ncbi:MAG TPA: DUF559 domain-containing protein [Pseudomonadales bacterium]